jgi:hypothetical protein
MSYVFDHTVPYVAKYLQCLENWIEKVQAHATAKKFDANTLLTARLAPDQFPLARQIQIACDNAKFLVCRGAGKDAPSHPDTELTWDELRTRIRAVRELVASFKSSDFDGIENRWVTLSFMPGKKIAAKDYVFEFAMANFYFHYMTAYSLLRHNGVDVGKQDFMGSIPLVDA